LKFVGFGRRHGERLLADDVPAGRHDGFRLRHVEVVGRRHVDRVDGRVIEQLVERGIGLGDTECLGARRSALRGAAQHAAHADADPPQRLHVDRADEACADDGRADVGDPPHAADHPTPVHA
jgi:hypothetical protein